MNKSITKYFKSALIAKNQNVIDFNKSDNKYEIITKENFITGLVDLDIYNRLNSNNKNTNNESIEVIIIPKTIKTKFENGKKIGISMDELTGVLYVPAVLNSRGELEIGDKYDRSPWIPREFLQPMIDPQLSLGKSDDVDIFLSKTTDQREKLCSWSDYVNYVKDFYQNVTKLKFDNSYVSEEKEEEFEEKIYIIIDETINSSFHVEKLYNDILNNEVDKPLYNKFISPSIEKSKKLIPNDSYLKMIDHKGQMGGEYPLSESQREAINHFSELKDGELLAVSGPPGTGKTTLLQSIVADIYVKSAMKKEKAPIIVASSTNNQAVTNIIDSFGSISSIGIRNLEERWIEGVSSFAVYSPSDKKMDKAEQQGYQCTNQMGVRFVSSVDSEDNMKKSENRMLESVSKYFNKKINSIEECKRTIHTQLVDIDKIKNEIIKTLKNIKDIAKNTTIEEYIKNLDTEIEQYTEKEVILEKNRKVNLDQINKCRYRVSEWNKIYSSIPWYIRLFKRLRIFEDKISNILKIHINSDELEFLGKVKNIDEILSIYAKKIELINVNNLNIKKEIENIKKYIEIKKSLKIEIENLRNKVKLNFIKLKEYNCDIYYKKDAHEIEKALNQCSLVKINEYIDTKVRYIEFWLAVHYYECRWLLKEDVLMENQAKKGDENAVKSLYNRLAMITPCIVMTFFMLPKRFEIKNSNDKISNYLYNFIDLLIVDEAGQVSPEIAAASFALAKKAIVVGDEKQIPPVWGINKALDESLAIKNGVINKDITFEKLIEFGQNCSQSSVMKISVNSCCYDKYDKGLFLSEHRRCYNEIIEYCNKLVYKGRLKPCRGEGKKDKKYPILKYPHMGYFNIDVANSERKGTSRVNEKEAIEIAKWLYLNYESIVKQYIIQNNNIKINEIIAIITPFKAQVKILKDKLNEYLGKYSKNIDVGTVHTFQGAERKIIILSTVYGTNDGCFFINQNDSLMNVAVSRAKDAFWIFGARQCLDEKGESSSSILRKYTREEIQ